MKGFVLTCLFSYFSWFSLVGDIIVTCLDDVDLDGVSVSGAENPPLQIDEGGPSGENEGDVIETPKGK